MTMPPSKVRDMRKRHRVFSVLLVCAALIALTALVSWLTRYDRVRITSWQIVGTNIALESKIEGTVQQALDGLYVYLFPKNSPLFFKNNTLVQELLKTYPLLNSVTIKRIGFNRISVIVSEREPYALYCGDSDEGLPLCYLIDRGGFIYSGSVGTEDFVKIYGSTDCKDFQYVLYEPGTIGCIAYTKDNFAHAMAYIDAFAQQEITIRAVTESSDKNVDLMTDSGFQIFVSLQDDPSIVTRFVKTAYDQKTIIEGRLSEELVYIDARFGNQIVFKFVGDESENGV